MCGRTCLTLEPNDIRCACKYKKTNYSDSSSSKEDNKNDEIKKIPEWRSEYNCGKKYQPSYNISPTSITPVLVSTKHFNKDDEQDRIIVPMMWGMIPFWHKGDYRKHGLKTNNCRLEHMLESKLYKKPFAKGQRCVVISEGFYEWQTTKSSKPSERSAYFIHMPQINDDIKIYDKNTWKNMEDLQLLKMAGLFDVWEDGNGDKIFSYSVITFESNDTLSWLHHRTPAILETEEQVSNWLDFNRVSQETALSILKMPPMKLSWYRISNIVNNSRNQSEQCNKPFDELKKDNKSSSIVPKSKIMQSWLIIRKRKEDNLKKELSDSDDDNKNGADDDDDLQPKSKYLKFRESKSRSGTESEIQSKSSTETEKDEKNVKMKMEKTTEMKKES